MNAVYLLCYAEEVVYVGKSINVKNRIANHRSSDKLFDSVVVIEIPNEADMYILEVVFINKYKPMYNIESKAEEHMTLSVKIADSTVASVKEYSLGNGGISEEDIVVHSTLAANVSEFLADIMYGPVVRDATSRTTGFSYTVLQKTALAVKLASSKKVTGAAAMRRYGVKPASYNILNRYFDGTNKSHCKILEDIINGSSTLRSVPMSAQALKEVLDEDSK